MPGFVKIGGSLASSLKYCIELCVPVALFSPDVQRLLPSYEGKIGSRSSN